MPQPRLISTYQDFELLKENKAYTFGVEIEGFVPEENYDEMYKGLEALGMDVGEDGSIKGYDSDCTSFEARTPILTLSTAQPFLQKACDIFKEEKASVNDSCGLHVHIGNIPNDVHYLLYLTKFIQQYESDLYAVLPNSRIGNQYCRPFDSNFWKNSFNPKIKSIANLESEYYGTASKSLLAERKSDHHFDKRYYGFNLHSFWFRKTIEYRYHSGTVDFKKIWNWMQLLNAVHKYVADNYEKGEMPKEGCLYRLLFGDSILSTSNYISRETFSYFRKRKAEFREKRPMSYSFRNFINRLWIQNYPELVQLNSIGIDFFVIQPRTMRVGNSTEFLRIPMFEIYKGSRRATVPVCALKSYLKKTKKFSPIKSIKRFQKEVEKLVATGKGFTFDFLPEQFSKEDYSTQRTYYYIDSRENNGGN